MVGHLLCDLFRLRNEPAGPARRHGDERSAGDDRDVAAAAGFAARPFGGVLFGHVGDRVGRRPAVAASVLLMAVAATGTALLPTYPLFPGPSIHITPNVATGTADRHTETLDGKARSRPQCVH